MRNVQRDVLAISQEPRSLDDVFNLPPIQLHLAQSLNIYLRYVTRVSRGVVLWSDERTPHMLARLPIKLMIIDRQVNARLECMIKV